MCYTVIKIRDEYEYENGCGFKHQIIEYRGKNCYIPSNGYCLIKCNNFLTGEDYKQEYFDFIRNENKVTLTKARIQPCLGKLGVNVGFYNGKEMWPRNIIERNKALFLHNNHFC